MDVYRVVRGKHANFCEKIQIELKRLEGTDIFDLYKEFHEKLRIISVQNNEDWMRAIQITNKIYGYQSKKKKKSPN